MKRLRMELTGTHTPPYGRHMETAPDVASRIRAAIVAAERTPAWVARKAGIALTTLNRKLNGGADFTVGEIRRIAQALRVPASSLLPDDFFEISARAEKKAVA